jgi:hypothetical protein
MTPFARGFDVRCPQFLVFQALHTVFDAAARDYENGCTMAPALAAWWPLPWKD